MEALRAQPPNASFQHANRDHVNAPGGRVSTSEGTGNHFAGATFNASVSIETSHQGPRADEAARRALEEKKACLRSLGFANIDARHDDIADAYPSTCDWLFSTNEFREWHDRANLPAHNGVLWIKGKPGAGKSTLMKHTLRHYKQVFPNHIIATYFFNARGEILEKTPLGMLRSIVCQLLQQDDKLYEQFRPVYENQSMFTVGELEWTQGRLKGFLDRVIRSFQSKPLLLFIDALDECNKQDIRDVVRILEIWSITAVQAGVKLRICLSCRHYPNVSMIKSLRLIVEASVEHGRDIATYIAQNLKGDDSDIVSKVRDKAGGIFMWVVLVVSLLNEAYDNGRMEAMRQALDDVPADLEAVFNMLLNQDEENKAETIRMLQWVLFSQRPLKPEELFFAVLAGTATEYIGPWNKSKIPIDAIHRRITASSKGLIEVRERNNTTIVQFIHLSVNDFLSRNHRLQTLDPTLEPDPISISHGQLWNRCWSDIKRLVGTAPSEKHVRQLRDQYPFLDYELVFIFSHAEKALAGNVMREDIVHWLQMEKDWFKWRSTFISTCNRPMDIYLSREAGTIGKPLYVLSAHGCHELVTVAITEAGADVNAQGGYYGNALQLASANGYVDIVQQLLKHGADVNAQGGQYRNALQAASTFGFADIVQQLLKHGADVNAQCGSYRNALQLASTFGYVDIVQQLIKHGADINAQGGHYGNALQAACANGNAETVQQLLNHGADVNAQSGFFGNALQAASVYGYANIVQRLLEHGADINAQGGHYGNALQAACAKGNAETVQQLLKHGADHVNSGILRAASRSRSLETVQLLLEYSINISSKAQQTASVGEPTEIMQLLAEYGVDVSNSALQAASAEGYSEMAQLLIGCNTASTPASTSSDSLDIVIA